MFTGIIESLGTVESVQSVGGDVRVAYSVPIWICQMSIWVIQLPPMAFASQ